MKVFHIISHFDLGGAERVAASIAKSDTAGMEYHIVEMMRGKSRFTKDFMAELTDAGVQCHRAWMPDIRFHFLFERLAAVLFPLRMLYIWLRWHPDVVHTHTESPDMGVVFAMRIMPWIAHRVKVVRTIHNNILWHGQEGIGRACESFFISHDSNVAISRSVQMSYMDRYGIQPPIIYNGVETSIQKRYDHLKDGKTNIIFAGRMEPQKGIDILIDVVSRLADDTRYHFHIFGNGSLKDLVCERLSRQGNVSVNPPLYGLSSYLSSFDYMFMPSEFEGLSIVAIEASMAGLPNIINNCRGLGETLPDDWPLRVEDNDVESFLYIFRHTLPTSSRHDLATKAQTYTVSHFSVGRMQQAYEKIYTSCTRP